MELTADQLVELSEKQQLVLGDDPSAYYKTGYACQGKRLEIGCRDASDVIRIVRANYGRFSVAICNDEGRTDISVNCHSPNSLQVMRNK